MSREGGNKTNAAPTAPMVDKGPRRSRRAGGKRPRRGTVQLTNQPHTAGDRQELRRWAPATRLFKLLAGPTITDLEGGRARVGLARL